MKRDGIKKKNTSSETEDSFEKMLEYYLSPKQANPEFVLKLKYRLQTEPLITLETRRKYAALWIIAVGLFAGALAIFLISRKRK